MRSIHPLRAIRASGWRTRTAAGLLATGLLAGGLYGLPADAHGTGKHFVTLSGRMLITVAGPDYLRTCTPNWVQAKTLQKGVAESARWDLVSGACEGFASPSAKGAIVMTAKLRDDKYIDIDGFIRMKKENCNILIAIVNGFSCTFDEIETRNFRAFVPEDFVQNFSTQTIADGQESVQFNLKVIVDGPDAPSMPAS